MNLRTKFRGLREIWHFDNRLWLILSRIFFPGEKLQIYRLNGMEFVADHEAGDANGAREVLTSPMYQRFFSMMHLERTLNVLDIGANNGGFALLINSNNLRLRKLVSVELNPRTFVRLHFNLHRNLDCEIEVVNAALCGEPRTMNLKLGSGSVSDSIYRESTSPNARNFMIEGLTFDAIFDSHFADEAVDICKIDVEGSEFEMFQMPGHERIRNCRYLIIEIHESSDNPASSIIERLIQMEFSHCPPGNDDAPDVHFFINNRYKATAGRNVN